MRDAFRHALLAFLYPFGLAAAAQLLIRQIGY
jgi:hypothetical protein